MALKSQTSFKKTTKLEFSYFLLLKLSTKFQKPKVHGTDLKTDTQTNATEVGTPEISPHIYSHMIFNKDIKIIQWGMNVWSSQQMMLRSLIKPMQNNNIKASLPITCIMGCI